MAGTIRIPVVVVGTCIHEDLNEVLPGFGNDVPGIACGGKGVMALADEPQRPGSRVGFTSFRPADRDHDNWPVWQRVFFQGSL
jgi:hypothetical protein